MYGAKNCNIQINNYKGQRFGGHSRNCKIYSPNKDTLKELEEKQIEEAENYNDNSPSIKEELIRSFKTKQFIHGHMPKEKKWVV